MITTIYTHIGDDALTVVYYYRFRYEHYTLYEPVRLALQRQFLRHLRPVRLDPGLLDLDLWRGEEERGTGIIAEILYQAASETYHMRILGHFSLVPLTPTETKTILFAREYAVQP